MSYLTEVVLPSVGLPDKPTYNMAETCQILDCNRITLWRKVVKGEIRMSQDKKVYKVELENYFCKPCCYGNSSKTETSPQV